MANTCFNFIQAFGESKEIKRLKNDILNNHWDEGIEILSISDMGLENNPTGIEFSTNTRWSPPENWVMEISFNYNVTIECEYEEVGSDICGKFGYTGGNRDYNLEFTYLEGRYNFLDWEDFIECDVMFHLEDPDPFDEFMERFSFVSDEHRIELEELFFEHS
jgi:hypothetical protein